MKFLKHFLMYGLPFGLCFGIYLWLSYGWAYGLIGGAAAGALFGSVMAGITIKQKNRGQKARETFIEKDGQNFDRDKDGLIFDSYANHIAGFFPTEGWLFLTKTALVFVKTRNKKGIEPQKIEIPLNSIQGVQPCYHRLNPNALKIIANGKEEKFIFLANYEPGKFVNNALWNGILQRTLWESYERNNLPPPPVDDKSNLPPLHN